MRLLASLLVLACVGSLAPDAAAFRVEADYRLVQESQFWISLVECSGSTSTVVGGAAIATQPGVGLGVVGGLSDTEVDGGEQVQVSFPQPRAGLAYRVASASNVDGDGLFGEGFVEPFDGDGESLGVFAVSGVGTVDFASLVGATPIGRFVLTAALDGIRLRGYGYELRPGEPASAGFRSLAGGSVTELVYCSVAVRAPGSQVQVVENGLLGGLGVTGGASSFYADLGEEFEIEFPEPVVNARYDLAAATDVDGDGQVGDHIVEAFGAQGESLGLRSVLDGESPILLTGSALFGNVLISRVRIVPTADQLQLGSVSFVPEPGGGAAAAALTLSGVGWRRARRRR